METLFRMNDDPDYPPKAVSDEALAWIMRLHSGHATKADRSAFAAWRAQGPVQEAAAREAELLWGEASHLHQDSGSGLVRPGRRQSGPSRRAFLGGAAGLGLVGAAGLPLGREIFRRLEADHVTGTAEIREIVLPDLSRMRMNARSAVAVDFSPQLRRVHLLEGQVFFDVAPDAARPFQVQARGTRVTALGTAFDVDANLSDEQVGVSVTRHAVRLESFASNLVLQEEERVVVAQNGRAGAVERQPRDTILAWLDGMYIAEERPLAEVVAALRPYYPGWIVVSDRDIGILPVSAVLSLRSPAQSLDALATGLPVRVRRVSNYLTVISAA